MSERAAPARAEPRTPPSCVENISAARRCDADGDGRCPRAATRLARLQCPDRQNVKKKRSTPSSPSDLLLSAPCLVAVGARSMVIIWDSG